MPEYNDRPLSQNEAKLVADFLKSKTKVLAKGWVTLWKLSPSEISSQFKVSVTDVLQAARRH